MNFKSVGNVPLSDIIMRPPIDKIGPSCFVHLSQTEVTGEGQLYHLLTKTHIAYPVASITPFQGRRRDYFRSL